MSRMLEALRQIESRTQPSACPSPAQWPGQTDFTPGGDHFESAPAMGDAIDFSQRMWQQVETALAADAAVLPPPLPADAGDWPAPETDRRPALPPSEAAPPAATGVTTDPYGALAGAVMAQLSPADATLLFTSAGPGEEKTATVARLAAALAERVSGGVLAIDGNLRAPQLAARLGVQSTAGLPDVLAGKVSWNDAVQPTVMRGLSVLPGGICTGGTAPDGGVLGPLLAEIRRHYRLVLVDAASLLYAETAPLAAACDATYLVVRLGSTARRAVAEAAAAIRQCQGCLRGSIVVS
jgi:Mrp family chromosome partitioning ATPase